MNLLPVVLTLVAAMAVMPGAASAGGTSIVASSVALAATPGGVGFGGSAAGVTSGAGSTGAVTTPTTGFGGTGAIGSAPPSTVLGGASGVSTSAAPGTSASPVVGVGVGGTGAGATANIGATGSVAGTPSATVTPSTNVAGSAAASSTATNGLAIGTVPTPGQFGATVPPTGGSAQPLGTTSPPTTPSGGPAGLPVTDRPIGPIGPLNPAEPLALGGLPGTEFGTSTSSASPNPAGDANTRSIATTGILGSVSGGYAAGGMPPPVAGGGGQATAPSGATGYLAPPPSGGRDDVQPAECARVVSCYSALSSDLCLENDPGCAESFTVETPLRNADVCRALLAVAPQRAAIFAQGRSAYSMPDTCGR